MDHQLSCDLRLSLGINASPSSSSSSTRSPPIKEALIRTALEENIGRRCSGLYVKVYLEGSPIGRKVNLLAHGGYAGLAAELSRMFGIRIHILLHRHRNQNVTDHHNQHEHYYLLTYEDREGDWMMVGDGPWRTFLGSVKRLKIVRAENFLWI